MMMKGAETNAHNSTTTVEYSKVLYDVVEPCAVFANGLHHHHTIKR
jgi:hypothetical protein